jgi:RNA polymerase sigma-70 factor (ECF subfamily)
MPAPPARFATTRWSLVRAAADDDVAEARIAWATLCETYWLPVYAFIRRRNARAEDAYDLTQAFFARAIEKGTFAEARRDRGRFRTFILTAVHHFLANERDARFAAKRGGGRAILSLDVTEGERRYLVEPLDQDTPDRVYERRWALTVLETALNRLASQQREAGREQMFAVLRPLMIGEQDSYADAARALGITDGHLRVALHRFRKQFGTCLREVVADTVDDPNEIDGELNELLAIVSR